MKTVMLSVKVPVELRDEARRLARERGIVISHIIRKALEEFVESQHEAEIAADWDTIKHPEKRTRRKRR